MVLFSKKKAKLGVTQVVLLIIALLGIAVGIYIVWKGGEAMAANIPFLRMS